MYSCDVVLNLRVKFFQHTSPFCDNCFCSQTILSSYKSNWVALIARPPDYVLGLTRTIANEIIFVSAPFQLLWVPLSHHHKTLMGGHCEAMHAASRATATINPWEALTLSHQPHSTVKVPLSHLLRLHSFNENCTSGRESLSMCCIFLPDNIQSCQKRLKGLNECSYCTVMMEI